MLSFATIIFICYSTGKNTKAWASNTWWNKCQQSVIMCSSFRSHTNCICAPSTSEAHKFPYFVDKKAGVLYDEQVKPSSICAGQIWNPIVVSLSSILGKKSLQRLSKVGTFTCASKCRISQVNFISLVWKKLVEHFVQTLSQPPLLNLAGEHSALESCWLRHKENLAAEKKLTYEFIKRLKCVERWLKVCKKCSTSFFHKKLWLVV